MSRYIEITRAGESFNVNTNVTTQIIQVNSLPEPSEEELGNIYQYIGETESNYVNGYFYQCTRVGNNYIWSQKEVEPKELDYEADYDRLDYGSGSGTKNTSYRTLSAGMWLLFISYDFDQASPSSNNLTLTFNIPNTSDDNESISIAQSVAPVNAYHKTQVLTPVVLWLTDTIQHRISLTISTSARYWRVWRRYIKIAGY